MRLIDEDGDIAVEATDYRILVRRDGSTARLEDRSRTAWADLSLLASVDTLGGPDETTSIGGPEVVEAAGDIRITWRLGSSIWRSKRLVVDAGDRDLVARVEVEGRGRLTDVTLLGGRGILPSGATGSFRSGATFASLFSPAPGDPRRIVRPATESSDISVSGGSEGGRGQWFFTPAPFVYAVTRGTATDPAKLPAGDWLTFGLLASPDDQRFLGFGYRPADRGFEFVLDYQGHTEIDGAWTSPAIVIAPAGDPYAGIREYRARLERQGLAPTADRRRTSEPGWWREPMFCGWGAQCTLALRAGLSLAAAPAFATQGHYDEFLDHLEARGVIPGTIVIDDKWQARYATGEPDAAKWPDLRRWIDSRHARGQRVLLWWKAWDPEGMPSAGCVRSADGTPIAVDPNEAPARKATEDAVRHMLSPEGLDADGIKIDFTARTPSGSSLSHRGGAWGVGLLRLLLSTIRDEAKSMKPESLLIGHVAEPSMAPLVDMIRLNDMLRLDDPEPRAPIIPQMRYRAAVVRAACPAHLVDTDDWCARDLASWREYTELKPGLGVPALYYASGLDLSGEEFEDSDYELLTRTWTEYRRREGLIRAGEAV